MDQLGIARQLVSWSGAEHLSLGLGLGVGMLGVQFDLMSGHHHAHQCRTFERGMGQGT